MTRRPLVLSPGMGIGPEVTLRALALDGGEDVVLAGSLTAIEAANATLGLRLVPARAIGERPAGGIPVFDPGDDVEPVAVAAARAGVVACLGGEAAALVTGPIHKGRLALRGFAYAGHTEFLGHLCGVERPVMAFTGGSLRVALVTTHLPLAAVPAAISRERVREVGAIAARALRDDLGIARPALAVCGLNPHAGEGGLFGQEEIASIGPACADLRAMGIDARGPVSAETAFLDARAGRVDLVVAMYHDQGLGPLKAVDFGRSVNWTLGLPIVRTSVDHGTADDLVGTGRADPSSMRAAIALAREIGGTRARRRAPAT